MAVSVTKRTGLALMAAAGLALLAGCDVRVEDYNYYTLSGAVHRLPPHPVSNPKDGPKFTFMPVVGVPTNQGDFVYRTIRDRLQRDKITVVNSLDDPTTYRVVLNLSAVSTNVWTTLVFEADVHDASGNRVHSFGGQVMMGAGEGDPWSGVSKGGLREIAAQIESGLYAWLTSRT